MTDLQEFRLIVYAPALVNHDKRAVTVAHRMECALPSLRLGWTISEEGRFVPLPDRDAWLAQGRSEGGFPLLCNGDEGHLITLTGYESSARTSPGGQTLLDVHVSLPLDAESIAAMPKVLEAVAEGALAYWGEVAPWRAAVEIAQQTSPKSDGLPRPLRGLPALKLSWDMRSPEIPRFLGWLNYWSAAAAQAIGFPDPVRDAELLSRSRSTATGGWVVRLTEAPLDLDNPTHLNVLLRAYERFPEIGGRAIP